ncbi:MAG: hypothetical protein AMS21_00930 [Gemmatimonas sp. SG8_38_2]|nr:MAG: hypothetical protein AMS21_00930 [Gemmatimonas sp. SG8_38_2]
MIRHKWYVFIECIKLGLWWRGLVHDLSKFLPSEWFAYANYFYGDVDGAAFDIAWLRHQHRNPHHWQYWLLREDSGTVKALEMPYIYAFEMVADWRGAGMAQGKPDTLAWYEANRGKMHLHKATRVLVEDLLGRNPF